MQKKEKNLLIKCKACGNEVAKGAKKCPSCGKDNRNFFMKHKILTFFIALFILGGLGGAMGDDTPVEDDKSTPVGNVNTETDNKETKEEEKVDDNVPTEYKSALKKAKSYSNTMNMSKVGVYNQLTSEYGEKFTPEAAQYAIDNVEVDWKENALKKAESYSKTMHMSKSGVYSQLISEHGEKFTAEEAQYAIDNVEADWKENALKKAQSYQETMSMSPNAVYDQLISEYGEKFTAEEAQYAIDNLE